MIITLSKKSDLIQAMKLLQYLKMDQLKGDSYTYVHIINAFSKRGDIKSMELLLKMAKADNVSSIMLYNPFIDLYSKKQSIKMVQHYLDEATKEGLRYDPVTYLLSTITYAKAGNLEKMFNMYKRMKEERLHVSLPIYSSMVSAVLKCKQKDQVLYLYEEAKKENKLDMRFYRDVLSSLQDDSKVAEEIIKEIIGAGFQLQSEDFKILLYIYSKGGEIDKMKIITNKLPLEWKSISFVPLLIAYANIGDWKSINSVFVEMTNSNVPLPDSIFIDLAKLLPKSNNIEEIWKFLDLVRKKVNVPEQFYKAFQDVLFNRGDISGSKRVKELLK